MAQDNPHPESVVRARQFEMVDDEGRVRVIVGELPTPDPRGGVFGVSLLSEEGTPRVTMAVDPDSGWLVLELDGNGLIQLGVNEVDGDAVDTRAVVHISDPDGAPLIRWRVADDGSLLEDRWS